MTQYITNLDVSVNTDEESQLLKNGFTKVPVDLNSGSGGKRIFLWYKTGDCPAITRIQFSFTDEMKPGLIQEGYQKVDKDLNAGAGGSYIYLWFYKGSTPYDVPIVDLRVSTDAESDAKMVQPLWERSACDLNRRAKGKFLYLWMKRQSQTYICDITATAGSAGDAELFRQGYIRVDEDTNRDARGAYVFIWYRQTTDSQKAIKDLQVSTDEESKQRYLNQGYEQVLTNLNEGTKGTPVYLWYKKEPIKMVTVILDPHASALYKKADVNVIDKNLNNNNSGFKEYLCFK